MNSSSATSSIVPPSPGAGRLFPAGADAAGPDDDARLRETLKRYSVATFEAARQLRQSGNPDHLPAFIAGVLERFTEPDRRSRLHPLRDDLCLAEDLGIDSLTMMEIVVLAEEVLPVSITNDELRQLRTVGEVRHFLEGKLGRHGQEPPTVAPR